MGKGQSPTQDELKFIYGLLNSGFSDIDILARYEELKHHDKLGSLPYRQDVRFIRQRRKEFEAARVIVEAGIMRATDPTPLKTQSEHQDDIRNIIIEWQTSIRRTIANA